MPAYLTPKQVSDALGVSSSTIRRWSELFAQHLSPAASPPPGSRRRYTPDDVALLRRVGELADEGQQLEEIARIIAVEPKPQEPPPQPLGEEPPPLSLVPFTDALSMVANQTQIIGAQARQIADLQERLSEQGRELRELRERLEKLEQEPRQPPPPEEPPKPRPWWERIFGS